MRLQNKGSLENQAGQRLGLLGTGAPSPRAQAKETASWAREEAAAACPLAGWLAGSPLQKGLLVMKMQTPQGMVPYSDCRSPPSPCSFEGA